MRLPLDKIRIDGGTQPRAAISEDTVKEYAEAQFNGATLPAIDVFFDGVDYWLADGFHRYHAFRQIALDDIDATVYPGTRREAVLFSVGVNQAHGLRRTNADKRKAVMTLLADEEWCQWSNAEIARRCGSVSPHLVAELRPAVTMQTPSDARTYTTKHGTEATMQTGNIGKPAKTRAAVQERREQMREMAAEGHTSQQIAAAVGLGLESCRNAIKDAGIEVPADRVTSGLHRHNATRIIEHMVMDAENLTADVNLIDLGDLDPKRFPEWLGSLKTSRDKLGEFIRQLMKEQQKHGEAA